MPDDLPTTKASNRSIARSIARSNKAPGEQPHDGSTDLHLTVKAEALPLFTTLLQSGIELNATSGQPLALLLHSLPGFTADYLAERVQTIFLDGTAIDDLTTPLQRQWQVVALSAAMPGLAGAIFRRNSFHAALRTATGTPGRGSGGGEITVRLKLFNSIARERGPELLHLGVRVAASALVDFFALRPGLLSTIDRACLAGREVSPPSLTDFLAVRRTAGHSPAVSADLINLQIVQADD